jgi:hypothetical protein
LDVGGLNFVGVSAFLAYFSEELLDLVEVCRGLQVEASELGGAYEEG